MEIKVADDVNDALTLPPALYTDPAVFAQERNAIFRCDWVAVARSEWLAAPNSYFTCDLVGDPILLTRDAAGMLRAFSNVCLHRACPIASGRGSATQLTCPYHRWTYALDGRVNGAPLMERARAFDRSALRLAPLAIEEWLGWVFVNADVDAAPLAPRLTALHDLIAPFGVEQMRLCKTLRFDSRWNWKVMVENFMESYHHMGAHPATLNATFPAAGTHWVDLPGDFALLENPPKDASAAPFWVMCVFPSMLFALTRGDTPTGFWYQMDLHGHDHFTLDIHLLAPPALAEDADFVAGYADIANAIHLEDIPMCEGVWKGLNSAYARIGRLSHLEAANWRFHRYLAERLAGA
jgi:phenylpropionate dioxygenase-like ring-hydroxylating dioxygenase large terminal subunit